MSCTLSVKLTVLVPDQSHVRRQKLGFSRISRLRIRIRVALKTRLNTKLDTKVVTLTKHVTCLGVYCLNVSVYNDKHTDVFYTECLDALIWMLHL